MQRLGLYNSPVYSATWLFLPARADLHVQFQICAGRLGLAASLQSCLLCGMGSITQFKEGLQLPNCLVLSKLHLVTVLNCVVLCVHVCMSVYLCVCGHMIICVCESVCMCA